MMQMLKNPEDVNNEFTSGKIIQEETARISFTKEQKAVAVNLGLNSEEPVSQIARNPGIHANTLHRWASQADKKEAPGRDGSSRPGAS